MLDPSMIRPGFVGGFQVLQYSTSVSSDRVGRSGRQSLIRVHHWRVRGPSVDPAVPPARCGSSCSSLAALQTVPRMEVHVARKTIVVSDLSGETIQEGKAHASPSMTLARARS